MTRLTRTDWLDHGLRSLEADGFPALKADLLAKKLKVSRGSFYWHFDDLAAFHTALLEHWLNASVEVAVQLETGDLEPADKLRALLALAAEGSTDLEQAVRAWAFSNAGVAATVQEVDRARIAYIATILGETGIDETEAQRRAVFLYLSNVGYSFLSKALTEAELTGALSDLADHALAP